MGQRPAPCLWRASHDVPGTWTPSNGWFPKAGRHAEHAQGRAVEVQEAGPPKGQQGGFQGKALTFSFSLDIQHSLHPRALSAYQHARPAT